MLSDLRVRVEPPWGVEPQTYALRVDSMRGWQLVTTGGCVVRPAHSVVDAGCCWWQRADLVRTTRGPPRLRGTSFLIRRPRAAPQTPAPGT